MIKKKSFTFLYSELGALWRRSSHGCFIALFLLLFQRNNRIIAFSASFIASWRFLVANDDNSQMRHSPRSNSNQPTHISCPLRAEVRLYMAVWRGCRNDDAFLNWIHTSRGNMHVGIPYHGCDNVDNTRQDWKRNKRAVFRWTSLKRLELE